MVSKTSSICPFCGRESYRPGSWISDTPRNITIVIVVIAAIVAMTYFWQSASGANAATTRPAIDDARQIVTRIPVSIFPAPSREWDEIANNKLNQWLAEHVTGNKISFSFKLSRVEVSKDGHPSTFAGVEIIYRGGHRCMLAVYANFDAKAADRLEKMKNDQVIHATGIVREAASHVQHSGPDIAVTVDVEKF